MYRAVTTGKSSKRKPDCIYRLHHFIVYIVIPYGRKFSWGENFVFFEDRAVNAKIKLGETPTHRYFSCKTLGGCGFLALKHMQILQLWTFLLRALEPNSRNLHLQNFSAIIITQYKSIRNFLQLKSYRRDFERYIYTKIRRTFYRICGILSTDMPDSGRTFWQSGM